MLKKLRKLFFGVGDGDGIFAPGGSIANMYAMVLARHREFPQVKTEGLFNIPPLVVFTSQDVSRMLEVMVSLSIISMKYRT